MNQFNIDPHPAMIIVKGTTLVSALELTKETLPAAKWDFELVDAGTDCIGLFDKDGNIKKGSLITEYGDKYKHIPTELENTWHNQVKLVKKYKLDNILRGSLKSNLKIKIEEVFMVPYYNCMGLLQGDKVEEAFTTIPELIKELNAETENLTIN